jgi:hypothetical protein
VASGGGRALPHLDRQRLASVGFGESIGCSRRRSVGFQGEPTHARIQRPDSLQLDDLNLRVLASAILAAVSVALDAWQRDGGKADVLPMLDRATNALASGARQLSARAAKAPA